MTPTLIILLICAERFPVTQGNEMTMSWLDPTWKLMTLFCFNLIGRRYGRTAGWHMPIPRVSASLKSVSFAVISQIPRFLISFFSTL
jgi:hypothetical protein